MRHRGWFALMGVTASAMNDSSHAVLAATGPVSDLVRAPLGFAVRFDWRFISLGSGTVSWSRRGFDTRRRDADLVLARITKGLRRATSSAP